MEPMLCDGCGKDMVNPKTGAALVSVYLHIHVGVDPEFRAKQFGAFAKEQYQFCYECWLRSLGAKPGK